MVDEMAEPCTIINSANRRTLRVTLFDFSLQLWMMFERSCLSIKVMTNTSWDDESGWRQIQNRHRWPWPAIRISSIRTWRPYRRLQHVLIHLSHGLQVLLLRLGYPGRNDERVSGAGAVEDSDVGSYCSLRNPVSFLIVIDVEFFELWDVRWLNECQAVLLLADYGIIYFSFIARL